ncbi:girdin [Euwallacea fornicatus]|uniref:girdin n=1 Tax=Euwallacea fornicatus TaxID=995702 RepID=UPI00338ED64A
MAASGATIEEFLSGPLVKWLSTCVRKPDSLQVYETFFDGAAINEVLLQIDPEPSLPVPSLSNLQCLHITAARIKIFHSIIRNVKTIYEDELGQLIINLPDCVTLGRAPGSEIALDQLKLLILLLLGCAVQGPTKEIFITRIKELDVISQHEIMQCIKQVTDDQNLVLTSDWTEQTLQKLFSHIKSLTSERDKLLQQWVIDLGQEDIINGTTRGSQDGVESNHLAVELADFKAKLRKQRQELDEKTEILAEYKEELEHVRSLVAKLKNENSDLLIEARKAKAYRDEADAMRENAERADRLDMEVQRYRERLADSEFYKARVDELREDNRVLLETREMLEEQLARARQRADQVLELEAKLLASKQTINEVMLERDAARDKIQELADENVQLQQVTKSALQESSLGNMSIDSDLEEPNSGDNSLSEQLTSNAQARALKLELENKQLLSKLDSLKEKNFYESANKILDLEKEKKKLLIKCEQLQENCDRLTTQNSELENLFKNAIQENRKVQNSMDSLKVMSDKQNQDIQIEKFKIVELEKNIASLSKEKQRVQALCDVVKKRADDAEKSLNQVSKELHNLQEELEKGREAEKLGKELQERVTGLEKENTTLQKEVLKLKGVVEEKEVSLDKNLEEKLNYEKDIEKLSSETSILMAQLEKLQEFEQKATELISQASVHSETIATLQKDLIAEKVNNEKFKTSLEKLGLNLDILDNDVNIIIETMLENSEISKCLQSVFKGKEVVVEKETPCKTCRLEGDSLKQAEEVAVSISEQWSEQCDKLYADIAALQSLNDCLQNENATLKVDVSTLKSQANSLQAQQTALQLANSQLVAEKDELFKQHHQQQTECKKLLSDQVTLRTLHEQLNNEYEEVKLEQENLRKINRDLRSEIRSLKERNDCLEVKVSNSEFEKVSLRTDSVSLNNLREEHSKLKDDFRNLFTASGRLKVEYRNVQEELKTLKMESRNLRLSQTEIQGELSSRSDRVAGLQLDNAKLQQKCDMLFEMNHSLDSDRRALMDHVSQLLNQYWSLLSHSLEDKKQFHLEEKQYSDKVNNLSRQKEKLEEKIMEHYRKLDNASAKKKGFGATLVRRVKKASSDIMNKVPSRTRRSWHDDSTRLSQSQFTLAGQGSGESDNRESDNSAEDVVVGNPRNAANHLEPFRRNTTGTGSLRACKPRDEVALRRSHRDLSSRSSVAGDQPFTREPGSALSLGSVGSRRTVYLSEDDTGSVAAAQTPETGNQTSTPPLLVYNRISTVIGAEASQSQTRRPVTPQSNQASTSQQNSQALIGSEESGNITGEKKDKNSKETAIWYEYGCV